MTATKKWSAAVRPDFEVIERLGIKAKWCVWKSEARGEGQKPAKVPHNGWHKISTNRPADWLSFEEARALYERGGFDGVGMLMSSCENQIVAVDIDNCLDGSGSIIAEHEAVAALVAINSCVEVSPSGTGLRGFAYGMTLDDCMEKVGNLEVYGKDSVRYVSVTGVPFGEYRPVIENQAAIEAFMVRFGFVKPKPMPPPPWKPAGPSACSHMRTAPAVAAPGDPESWPAKSDDEILKLLRQNNKRGAITRLLEGNTVDYGGGVSESRAALIGHLAYYSNDVEQIARIVEASGLLDTKKGQERDGKPFAVWEVERVLDGLSGRASYWVDRAEKAAGSAVAKARTKTLKEKGAAHLDGDIAHLLNGRGVLRNTSAVMAEILKRDRRLAGAVFFDLFALMPFKTELFAAAFGVRDTVGVSVLKDSDLRAVEAWLFREYGIEAKRDDVRRAVLAWADSVAVNPVTDRLDELAAAWDGKPRLATWFVDYLGAVVGDDEELALYYSVIGTRFLISCVARAYRPGCKVDTMLIIEGVQGAKKSSGMFELTAAVLPRAFLEGFSIARLDKDTKQSLRGRLMAEIGELDGMNRHEAEGLKNFVSTRIDTYRDPYGTFNEDFPRTVVFVGTTNESTYLRDPTGNRRYWPLKVRKVNLVTMRRDAEQFWGEAVYLFKQGVEAGGRWWIDEDDTADVVVRRIQQRECLARMVPDSWADLIGDFMEKLATGKAAGMLPRKSIDTDIDGSWKLTDLMMLALGDEGGGRRSVPEETRFRAALKRCGWQHNGSDKHGRWKLSAAAKTELLSWVR